MTNADQQLKIARAREHADLARMRFENAWNATIRRAAPDRLTSDALSAASNRLDDVKQELLRRIRHWPIALGIVSVGLGLLVFWRPARAAAQYASRLTALAWTYRTLWRPKE